MPGTAESVVVSSSSSSRAPDERHRQWKLSVHPSVSAPQCSVRPLCSRTRRAANAGALGNSAVRASRRALTGARAGHSDARPYAVTDRAYIFDDSPSSMPSETSSAADVTDRPPAGGTDGPHMTTTAAAAVAAEAAFEGVITPTHCRPSHRTVRTYVRPSVGPDVVTVRVSASSSPRPTDRGHRAICCAAAGSFRCPHAAATMAVVVASVGRRSPARFATALAAVTEL
jgi:hypothetical protein